MNFLGHIYLAGNDESLIIGNFIADFVKGKAYRKYPKDIQHGIQMHRQIDHFTDNHASFLKSNRRLFTKYRHYAGVITDIFFDHYLAKNWGEYHHTPLNEFAAQFYSLVYENYDDLPERVQYMFYYMRTHNWLYNYQYLDGISRTLQGLSRRTAFDSGMERAIEDLRQDYSWHEGNFKTFFRDIKSEFRPVTSQS
ncbi:MAG TPA: DUF479 domain-containing protein [Cytophagales bacterium]|nr:DUF479 domain-containing protein [Cytophagales bacterium]